MINSSLVSSCYSVFTWCSVGIDTCSYGYVTLNLSHYDRPSLLAGKLHAVLTRPYTKGRDLYDLVWYLSDRSWPQPNLELLNAALWQTKWQGPKLTNKNWQKTLFSHLSEINWPRAIEDVRPFLEREQDVDLLSKENLRGLLNL